MRLHQLSCLGFAALALGLTPACSGGQTGDLSGQNDGKGQETGNGSGCDEHKQVLADFDEATSAGTASELLEYAETTFDAPISWMQPSSGQSWQLGPESGEGVLHVSVTRGAKAYQLTYSAPQSGSGAEIGSAAICPPSQLGLEAHVTVTTDGGALSESFDTLLRSDTAGVALLSLPLDLQNLNGTLTVSSSQPGTKLVQARLEAVLTAQGTTGSIGAIEQVEHGSGANGVTSASSALFAVWPGSDSCQGVSSTGDGLELSLTDEVLGYSGTASIDSVTPAAGAPIEWLDGSKTTLTVGIEATGAGCFHVRKVPIPDDAGPAADYPVAITLESEDGRVSGSYAGFVTAAGVGSARRVSASAVLTLPVADAAQTGFTSLQVPSGAETLLLQLDSSSRGGKASGSVQVFSLSSPPCPMTAPTPGGNGASSPGCPGQTRTSLEAASWSE